jgi:hypothetical protein
MAMEGKMEVRVGAQVERWKVSVKGREGMGQGGARGWEVAGETNGNMHAGNHAPPGHKWKQELGAYIPLGFAQSVLCAGVERAWIGVADSGRE